MKLTNIFEVFTALGNGNIVDIDGFQYKLENDKLMCDTGDGDGYQEYRVSLPSFTKFISDSKNITVTPEMEK